MNILAITLARGGSKSVFKKNIKLINGKPLLTYTISEALKSKFITRYIVSTDDHEIQKIAIDHGAEAPFLRPNELSTDASSSADALLHCLNWAEKDSGVKYDYVIELMATNPLKTFEDIDHCIEKIIKTGADTVIAVAQLYDNHPSRIKKIENDKIIDFNTEEIPESRRQGLEPKAYVRAGSIYCINRDYLIKEEKRYGSDNSRPYILPPSRYINIDEINDFILAEIIIKKNYDK